MTSICLLEGGGLNSCHFSTLGVGGIYTSKEISVEKGPPGSSGAALLGQSCAHESAPGEMQILTQQVWGGACGPHVSPAPW